MHTRMGGRLTMYLAREYRDQLLDRKYLSVHRRVKYTEHATLGNRAHLHFQRVFS